MAVRTKLLGLTGNQLKILALILMTVDHLGALLLTEYEILRVLGRLSMPIFAWMIAEGCHHTRSRLRYFLTVAVIAILFQTVYYVALGSIKQCILVTFSMSILLIYCMDFASVNKGFLSLCLMGAAFCGACFVCIFLPRYLPGTNFSIDYGLGGVLLPVVFFAGKNKPEKLMLGAACLALMAMSMYHLQWYALLALPVLALYNGQKGRGRLKYLFYIYYPLHLAAIYGISLMMEH